MYCTIITEERVTFVNELSVVAPCSKIIRCFIGGGGSEDKTWFGLVEINTRTLEQLVCLIYYADNV